ncbi:unnamed protein product [Effrenium voratum]|uniref:Uncharacterized protein n=1 Tax=Effrenium voratum TaxID=2562239 RepID=A0AA36J131_9DINO|nr:unnamed protein product [Effrenium voratum]
MATRPRSSFRQTNCQRWLAIACLCAVCVWPSSRAWVSPWRSGTRSPRVMCLAVQPLVNEMSEVFQRCVEEYSNENSEEFQEGPPATGFRNLTECIRPYHPNPEWQLFPGEVGSFERDQKICSMYTLATGLFRDINKCIRDDNEDGLRRLAPMVWEIREVLRFETAKICKPDGRKCKPFMGKCLRGLEVPEDEVEEWASLYKEGTEFTWPAFTSCQLEDGGLWPFDGNLNFEIECNIDPSKLSVPEVFAPVSIKRFIGGSNEVLFPPQTKFRVKEDAKDVQRVTENDETRDVHTRVLEVVELPVPQDVQRAAVSPTDRVQRKGGKRRAPSRKKR